MLNAKTHFNFELANRILRLQSLQDEDEKFIEKGTLIRRDVFRLIERIEGADGFGDSTIFKARQMVRFLDAEIVARKEKLEIRPDEISNLVGIITPKFSVSN